MNIKLPYMEKSGESQISVFSKTHFISTTVTNYLISEKGGFFVNDAVSFLLKLGSNFLNVAETFFSIAKSKKDTNSAFALFRVQADYLATLLLIFEGKSEDETKFRYLLYLLDGISQRADSLEVIPQYKGDISQEDYNALVVQMTNAKQNAQTILDFCYNAIDKHPYKTLNQTLYDKIVKNKQWKYKEFSAEKTSYEFFKWQDLYPLIDKRPDVASFISLCSHHVHGNVNSLLSDIDDDTFDPIIHFNTVLIMRYLEMLKKLWGESKIKDIINFCLFGVTIKFE
nr:hypothetical protein [Bacteroides acidifaciens]